MDVSANFNISDSPKLYLAPTTAAAPVNRVAPPVDGANAGDGGDSYAPSASQNQIATAVTVAPSSTPSEVDAAVHRLPVSVRYAPSPAPRDASLAAPFDRRA